ncbi:MAG: polysaccharide pyruvyl transferase family protein [Bacilli bacterium]
MKIGIVTINDYNNYGNRLQNYAVQEILESLNNDVTTLINYPVYNFKKKFFLRRFRYYNYKTQENYSFNTLRKEAFIEFNRNINFSTKLHTIKSCYNYDYLVVGSDQVWNPNFGRLSDLDLLCIKNVKKVALSASFGISELPQDINKSFLKLSLEDFKAISVREESGKNILSYVIPGKEVEVLIDPTMIVNVKIWDKISKRPKMLKSGKFILNYFLGELSSVRKKEIERIAKENDCIVINLLDINDIFYECGPSEFLYLEKNAFLICTDSFHSSVFAILFNRPFIIFNRNQDGVVNMSSRLDTLIHTFKLENRYYNEVGITKENLYCDYTEAHEILTLKRLEAMTFIKKSFQNKDEETISE